MTRLDRFVEAPVWVIALEAALGAAMPEAALLAVLAGWALWPLLGGGSVWLPSSILEAGIAGPGRKDARLSH